MHLNMLDEVKKFVIEAWKDNKNDIRHAERTAYWVKRLKPDADEALLIAAWAHDIERAVYGDWKKGTSDPKALAKHQDLSAKLAGEFLESRNAAPALVLKVRHLVEKHETGGDAEQNILCDADCLSFFEDKAVARVRKWKAEGKDKNEIKKNMDFYFSRFISPEAREIARRWYRAALDEIE
jgi:hypothetical protein